MGRERSVGLRGGRVLILATLFALCAAVMVPNQASAASLTKKASFTSTAAVASCQYTVEHVDQALGTTRFKYAVVARPRPFQFNNQITQVACLFLDADNDFIGYELFQGGNTINQSRRVTIPTSSLVDTLFCGQSLVTKRNGDLVNSQPACAPA